MTWKVIIEFLRELFAWLVKVWPTWTERRQTKIDNLRRERVNAQELLLACQAARDGFLFRRLPADKWKWLQNDIDRHTATIKRCSEQLKALGSQ